MRLGMNGSGRVVLAPDAGSREFGHDSGCAGKPSAAPTCGRDPAASARAETLASPFINASLIRRSTPLPPGSTEPASKGLLTEARQERAA